MGCSIGIEWVRGHRNAVFGWSLHLHDLRLSIWRFDSVEHEPCAYVAKLLRGRVPCSFQPQSVAFSRVDVGRAAFLNHRTCNRLCFPFVDTFADSTQ